MFQKVYLTLLSSSFAAGNGRYFSQKVGFKYMRDSGK